MHFNYVVFKITFPNGKIYVGSDTGGCGHSNNYFGSWCNQHVEKDFTKEQLKDFTIRREIIFDSPDKIEVMKKEGEYIRKFKSNDVAVGYNRTHKSKSKTQKII